MLWLIIFVTITTVDFDAVEISSYTVKTGTYNTTYVTRPATKEEEINKYYREELTKEHQNRIDKNKARGRNFGYQPISNNKKAKLRAIAEETYETIHSTAVVNRDGEGGFVNPLLLIGGALLGGLILLLTRKKK
jgi:hypothetical protein